MTSLVQIMLLTLSFTFSSYASAVYIYYEKSTYTCSNEQKYDVLFHFFSSDQNPWELVAFCQAGTLTLEQGSYDGTIFPYQSAHPDIKACIENASEEVEFCYQEFLKNGANAHEIQNLSP